MKTDMRAKQPNTKEKQNKKTNPVVSVLMSAFAALLLSFVLTALCALLLQNQTLGIESIKIINPVIKSVSALAAALIAARKIKQKSWLAGLVAGFVYSLLSFLIFSLLSGDFGIGTGTLLDLIMCSAAGMTGGIVRSLVKNS